MILKLLLSFNFVLNILLITVMAEEIRGQLVGGLKEQEIKILDSVVGNGKTLWDYLQNKIEEYAKQRNSLYMYGINDIHVQSQVVQGVLYKVTLDLAPTDCHNNKFLSEESNNARLEMIRTCSINKSHGSHEKHVIDLWVRSWLPENEKVIVSEAAH
uniref:Cystatin domain-containing protein n=1 Tax=Clytia hemisphaerica TaxID=252671 RepID=A0A7M5U6X4_9CNID|eukprot:TCONS_00022277-protein